MDQRSDTEGPAEGPLLCQLCVPQGGPMPQGPPICRNSLWLFVDMACGVQGEVTAVPVMRGLQRNTCQICIIYLDLKRRHLLSILRPS